MVSLPLVHDRRPEVESFYHLPSGDVKGATCQGLACFVARHRRPETWQRACDSPCRVYCLGRCYDAPACGQDVSQPFIRIDAREAIVLERIHHGGARTLDEYRRRGGYEALKTARAASPEQVIGDIERSQLRGRGGAAFPTGKKWRAAMEQPPQQKYVVANADEGDAGAYVDRFIMEDDPHCLIEAMAIAGHAVGASKGFIYLRCEYPDAKTAIENALSEARHAGYLGSHFEISIHLGLGSYVCGEETSLLNSIQGERPFATPRPPYATQRGLFGRPTVVNNVETLANVPWIIRHGGRAYSALGFSQSRGTKVISLNSLFNRPGLYEVEFGVSLRHIIEGLGGGLKSGTLHGVMVGGPLAGVVPPRLLDTPFGFEEMRQIGAAVGHGGVIAFDEHTSIAQLVQHVFTFGAAESCGKCVPCRLGTRRIERMFDHIVRRGRGTGAEREEWVQVVQALKLGSLCGFGTGLAEFALSIDRHFGEELASCFN
jgi:NADH:ubiquinone oxidoreductase subunit F (NADH-binding)